jgi:DNA topoisomerase-1
MKFKQRPHLRKSTKGKIFPAGRGTVKRKVKVITKRKNIYIPPAWKKVKYYKDKEYVATGIDEKGRLQYIYPKKFVEKQNIGKHKRINKLQAQMPALLKDITKDADKGNQEAQAVYTMYKTGLRPGTDRDTLADKKAYGVTTLLKKHVKVNNNTVLFDFPGKKGVHVNKSVKDPHLAKYVKNRVNYTELFDTNTTKVRSYFNKKTHHKFKIKDLRTLKAKDITATVPKTRDKKLYRKEVGKVVAAELGNTPTVALSSYVDPKSVNP